MFAGSCNLPIDAPLSQSSIPHDKTPRCPICQQLCTQMSLNEHLRDHHGAESCHYTTTDAQDFTNHMVSHHHATPARRIAYTVAKPVRTPPAVSDTRASQRCIDITAHYTITYVDANKTCHQGQLWYLAHTSQCFVVIPSPDGGSNQLIELRRHRDGPWVDESVWGITSASLRSTS